MLEHRTHGSHAHIHGPACGHAAVRHGDHVDYAHEGHLHRVHDGHVDECRIDIDARNAADCAGGHDCAGHDKSHRHGRNCGHKSVPHGDHTDYLVSGHLHYVHDGHCDHHGPLERA